jgi:hypothetical protein
MVEYLLLAIDINHSVHTISLREAVETQGLARPTPLCILHKDRNPADRFDQIRCLLCWVDRDQLPTEIRQPLALYPNTVKTQALQSHDTLTKSLQARGPMKFRPLIHLWICLVLLRVLNAIPPDPPSTHSLIFRFLKLHRFLNKSPGHLISLIAALH